MVGALKQSLSAKILKDSSISVVPRPRLGSGTVTQESVWHDL